MEIIAIIFYICIIIILCPVIIFSVQVFSSLFALRQTAISNNLDSNIIVLIPAHNEGVGIIATLDSIYSQGLQHKEVIVIADNCDDDTAEIALANGATVIKRQDESRRGKSYALDFGIKHIRAHYSPDFVVIVDADCLLQPGSLEKLIATSHLTNRPAQALYLMHAPDGSGLKIKIAEFAWLVKNQVRAMGFYRLGLPCQLMGSGMAFPWDLIRSVDLASGHIVEDLKLGIDLARIKHAPVFCPAARVTSFFPMNNEGITSQRTRWEHGHLAMIFKEGPKLIYQGVVSLNIEMVALAIDMCVPPLALLTLIAFGLFLTSLIMVLVFSVSFPWIFGLIGFPLLAISILIAWSKFGRNVISFSDLAYAPIYAMLKIPLYLKFIVKRQAEWVRSRRD